jgi:hypothetical protein
MNTKFYSCLLALGTFTSAVLLGIAPASAGGFGDNGSGTTNNVQFITGYGSNGPNGSNTTNNVQPIVVQITTQALATVNTILGANPQALSSVSSPAALVPAGAGQSVSESAAALSSAVGGLNAGGVTAIQLNNAFNAYNAHAAALCQSPENGGIGGEKALAFLSSAGDVKSKDGTPAPNLRSQLLQLRQAAGKP